MPYRINPDGSASVMLITSRETRRWVIPKGNPMRGMREWAAAEREAFEEAGISGVLGRAPLGTFHYGKRRADGSVRAAEVEVFPLAVTSQSDTWPEQSERDTRWFSLDDAADAVDEPELSDLIREFREPG